MPFMFAHVRSGPVHVRLCRELLQTCKRLVKRYRKRIKHTYNAWRRSCSFGSYSCSFMSRTPVNTSKISQKYRKIDIDDQNKCMFQASAFNTCTQKRVAVARTIGYIIFPGEWKIFMLQEGGVKG